MVLTWMKCDQETGVETVNPDGSGSMTYVDGSSQTWDGQGGGS